MLIINFTSQINGRQVLFQERIPGVALTVAWPYLSQAQKDSFKAQARDILRQLHTIKPSMTTISRSLQSRSHVVSDPFILNNGRINPLEEFFLSSHPTEFIFSNKS